MNTNIEASLESIDYNDNEISVFDDVDYVTGTWTGNGHYDLIDNASTPLGMPLSYLTCIKLGATWPDQSASGLTGMVSYSQYHGYFTTNYLAAYIYMTKVANNSGGATSYSYTPPGMNIFTTTSVNNVPYTSISSNLNNATSIKYFIWGMAIHTATDTFAHSAWKQHTDGIYYRLKHNTFLGSTSDGINNADSPQMTPGRYDAAMIVTRNALSCSLNGTPGSVSDFILSNMFYNNTYYLYRIKDYATELNENQTTLLKLLIADLEANIATSKINYK